MKENKKEIIKIWKSLRELGEYDGITLSPEIQESWQRSEAFGVNPYKRCCDIIISPAELEERKAANQDLIEHSTIMMGHLHRFMEGSGFVFALTDRDGYFLKRIGDKEGLDFTGGANLTEGAKWSEDIMGTNANSLALVLGKPVQLLGYEHFCLCASIATCSASPIFDKDGCLIGVMNIIGPYHLVNRHTMGMAVATSRAIERQMALHNAYQQSEMANLHKAAIMDSISDGVLTLDHEGRIIHINQQGAANLGIDYSGAVGEKLTGLMVPENELFFTRISGKRRLLGEPLVIRRKNDSVKLAVSCTPLASKEQETLGTVVIIQPMQQYKKMIERISGAQAKMTFSDIIGRSADFEYAIQCAEMAAKTDSNILLLGESGVGKDMFAQAIHNAGSRCREPFFAINCAALPRELVSSELFGYEEGAFTGARKGGNPGKFELADQGTIFLDEIGEMPLDLQGSLLRVLEEGNVVRLGGRDITSVNVRIIAATNKNLKEEVRKGNFRLDLYYRLRVIDIKIPPLRDRKDDIPILVDYFIKTIAPRLGKEITQVDEKVLDILSNYDWPGNVRELSNVIERAINMSTEETLTADDISLDLKCNLDDQAHVWRKRLPKDPEMQEQIIRSILHKNNYNKTRAAQELGISRSSLYRKMGRFSIQ
ncbi:MAG: sigma 54-interacting transcriptional regulator [Syntrophomonadaceae bacterium]|mgnify:CR=1 FL=1|nr:sigma 54-interacting transcriptional regulator [Syntrophomonadaceae bacterium]